MRIKILGTRGEIEASKPYHSKHSGVLVDGKLLFDLGEKQYLELKPKHIFITHLHPDHAYFVRKGKEEKIERKLYTPENFRRAGTFGKYRVRPIPTIHSKKVDSQAYIIEKGGKKVLYTGDLVWIEKKQHRHLKNLDLVIAEASFVRKGGMVRRDKETGEVYGHKGVPGLINLFKKFTDRIIFMHFGSWLYGDVPKAMKKLRNMSDDVEVRGAYDGFEFEV